MKKVLGVGIFGVIIFILLLIVFSSYLRSGDTTSFTFMSLLDVFSDVPSIDVSWSKVDLTIYADWGVFNFLKSFLNWFTSIWEFFIVVIGMIYEGLGYIFYLVRNLFV